MHELGDRSRPAYFPYFDSTHTRSPVFRPRFAAAEVCIITWYV